MPKRSASEQEFLERVRPKWNYWLALPTWTIHEAVMLSVGVDPQHADSDFEWVHESEDFDWVFFFRNEASTRADIANRWHKVPIDDGGLREPENLRGPGIRPQKFVELFRRLNLELPPELSGSNVEGMLVSAGRWPWGDYETEMLRHLRAAAVQWWVPYHEKKLAKAPTQKTVAGSLIKKGVSGKKAKAIAQVLHTDDPLPRGPRR